MKKGDNNWSAKKRVAVVILGIIGLATIATIISPAEYQDNKSKSKKDSQSQIKKDPSTLDVSVSHDGVNVIIVNKESKDLGDCKLKLNEEYIYDSSDRYLVNANQKIDIGFSNFATDSGERFNVSNIKPQYLRIDCDRMNGTRGSADIFWD